MDTLTCFRATNRAWMCPTFSRRTHSPTIISFLQLMLVYRPKTTILSTRTTGPMRSERLTRGAKSTTRRSMNCRGDSSLSPTSLRRLLARSRSEMMKFLDFTICTNQDKTSKSSTSSSSKNRTRMPSQSFRTRLISSAKRTSSSIDSASCSRVTRTARWPWHNTIQ